MPGLKALWELQMFWSGWNDTSPLVEHCCPPWNTNFELFVSILVCGSWCYMLLHMKTQHTFKKKYILFISPKGKLESYFQLLATETQFPV